MCGARYKTRPGLTYHLSHFHGGSGPGAADGGDAGDGDAGAGGGGAQSGGKYPGDSAPPAGTITNSAGDVVDGRHLFLPLHFFQFSSLPCQNSPH